MDDITFVRSHWWLVSEGFSLSTALDFVHSSRVGGRICEAVV